MTFWVRDQWLKATTDKKKQLANQTKGNTSDAKNPQGDFKIWLLVLVLVWEAWRASVQARGALVWRPSPGSPFPSANPATAKWGSRVTPRHVVSYGAGLEKKRHCAGSLGDQIIVAANVCHQTLADVQSFTLARITQLPPGLSLHDRIKMNKALLHIIPPSNLFLTLHPQEKNIHLFRPKQNICTVVPRPRGVQPRAIFGRWPIQMQCIYIRKIAKAKKNPVSASTPGSGQTHPPITEQKSPPPGAPLTNKLGGDA